MPATNPNQRSATDERGYYRDRMDSEPIEWPPPADEARKAALAVADITGDVEACAEVLEEEVNDVTPAMISVLDARTAARLVVAQHYLHRRPPISHAFGIHVGGRLLGAVTYGTPASRHLQISACPTDPGKVLELNRLWLDDSLPRNSESWFVSRTLKMLPPRIVVSYADPLFGHYGYIYRALNFRYAGWTDMERKTPRYDYIPHDPRQHTREAFRSGYAYKRRRVAKVKYWTTTGNPTDRRILAGLCGWPSLNWRELPPPTPAQVVNTPGGAA